MKGKPSSVRFIESSILDEEILATVVVTRASCCLIVFDNVDVCAC